jgi:hypothetical protein
VLGLDYNDELSMSGRKLPLRNSKGENRGGFRTVYDVKTDVYERLAGERLSSRR